MIQNPHHPKKKKPIKRLQSKGSCEKVSDNRLDVAMDVLYDLDLIIWPQDIVCKAPDGIA